MSKLNAKCQRVLALSIVVLLQVKCFCTTSSMKYLLFAHQSLLKHQMVCAVICDSCFQCSMPCVGLGHPLPLFSLVHSLPHLLLFFYFFCLPFFIRFTYFLLLSIPSLFSTKVVPLRFQTGGHRRRLNLPLVYLC